MAARRRYIWRYTPDGNGPEAPWVADQASQHLAYLCDQWPQHYSEPRVAGVPFGFVEIGLVVSAKDRWKIPWRVRARLLPSLLTRLHLKGDDLVCEETCKMAPHTHPNRAARWHGKVPEE